jgi:hypothetical protein
MVIVCIRLNDGIDRITIKEGKYKENVMWSKRIDIESICMSFLVFLFHKST